MGSGGKDEKMEDAAAGRKGGEETSNGGGDGKLKEKEAGQFSEGDKVLAYHGPLIYEAKIQRAEFRKKEWKYFVHYLGWSKNWDEWVGTDRLMALTDSNLEVQKKLFKNQNVDKHSKGRLPQARQKAAVAPTESKGEKEAPKINSVPKGKKRKADSALSEEKETDETDHVMKIPIPAVLKKQLVDDMEWIQSGKSIKLPRRPNVEDILKKFLDSKAKRDTQERDSLGEILNGLLAYFNKALPVILLYKQERGQYAEAVPDDSKPSLIYGAEHLLRLFVKLPELLVYTNLEEETSAQLQQKLLEFLKFLQRYQSSFFLLSYEGPKGGARTEPEEKKQKRESSRSMEEKKDRRDVLRPPEDKRDKRVGTKAVEDRRDKKDVFKPSEERKERKESSKAVVEEKKDRKDALRPSDEKRVKKDAQKASEDKREKRDSSKSTGDGKEKMNGNIASEDKKEKKDNSRSSDDKKEKDSSKSSHDKKEKKDSSKSSDDKKEKKDSSKSSDDKKEKENSKVSDDKKEKSSVDKKEKKDSSKSSDDKKEKRSGSKASDGKKETKNSPKSVAEKEKKDSSKPSDDKKKKK